MPRFYGGFTIAFVAALLVIGILIFSMTMNSTTSVSAVEAKGVGVYWDSDCGDVVSSIDWGTLGPGLVKNIVVYIRNEEDEPIFLIKSTTNWNPSEASEYITFGWDYGVRRIDPNEAIQITLTLSVSFHIEGISSFSFNIRITGSDRLPGDVNDDGTVDGGDQIIVGNALWSEPYPGFNWECYNPYADVNRDGNIDGADLMELTNHLWESWP